MGCMSGLGCGAGLAGMRFAKYERRRQEGGAACVRGRASLLKVERLRAGGVVGDQVCREGD